jgi:hypothetical protein
MPRLEIVFFCDLDEDATEGVKVRFGEEVVLPQPPFPVPLHLYGLLKEQDQKIGLIVFLLFRSVRFCYGSGSVDTYH